MTPPSPAPGKERRDFRYEGCRASRERIARLPQSFGNKSECELGTILPPLLGAQHVFSYIMATPFIFETLPTGASLCSFISARALADSFAFRLRWQRHRAPLRPLPSSDNAERPPYTPPPSQNSVAYITAPSLAFSFLLFTPFPPSPTPLALVHTFSQN